MQTITIKGHKYPSIEASKLESGMVYWDGCEISGVVVTGKTVRFVLAGFVERTVRSGSLIALSEDQIAMVI